MIVGNCSRTRGHSHVASSVLANVFVLKSSFDSGSGTTMVATGTHTGGLLAGPRVVEVTDRYGTFHPISSTPTKKGRSTTHDFCTAITSAVCITAFGCNAVVGQAVSFSHLNLRLNARCIIHRL